MTTPPRRWYLSERGMSKGFVLGSCTILETAGQGAVDTLYKVLVSADGDSGATNSRKTIWIRNSGAFRFAIEHQAFDEATFHCLDDLGWKPQKTLIVPADGSISRMRETPFPVYKIAKTLFKMGHDVAMSSDARRFVCNYVYYHSLRFAEQRGIKSLFVHVPLFTTIDEDSQMEFVASLLEVVASMN